MKTQTISVEIRRDLLALLDEAPSSLAKSIRLESAIAFICQKRLGLGKAAQLAGLNRLAFMDHLVEREIVVFDYDEAELETELAGLEHLRGCARRGARADPCG